jgi:hypothetical protein
MLGGAAEAVGQVGRLPPIALSTSYPRTVEVRSKGINCCMDGRKEGGKVMEVTADDARRDCLRKRSD